MTPNDEIDEEKYVRLKNQLGSNEELGPLHANWFGELTKASIMVGSGTATEQDPLNTTLPSGQGECFKTPSPRAAKTPFAADSQLTKASIMVGSGTATAQDPLNTTLPSGQGESFKTPSPCAAKTPCAVDSQLFSTPKIFRRSSVQSPETEEEELFSPEQGTAGTTLPWASQCLFGPSKERISINRPGRTTLHPQDGFEFLGTPKTPVEHSVRHISESLGAQIDDVSWTSSLNTPPVLSPTIILSKNEDSTCPVSPSADQEVIFVRKLFPSLSNTAGIVLSSENSDKPPVQHNDCHQPGLVEGSPHSQHASPEEGVWRQTLPDAIEDGDVRSTVASVLDGADEVLSIFFSNSGSALRRVKAKERIKRKQSSSKGLDSITMGIEKSSEKAPDEHSKDAAFSTDKRSTTKTEDAGITQWTPISLSAGITQWTPISLSAVSDCGLDTLSHDATKTDKAEPNPLTAKKQTRGPDSSCQQGVSQLIGSGAKSSLECCSSIKKNRKFVYRVQNPQTPVQEKDTSKTHTSPENSLSGESLSVKQRGNIPGEGCRPYEPHKKTLDGNQQQEWEIATAPPIPTKDHDLDMSQLCRVFAQDFSQLVDSKVGSKKVETVQNGFPSLAKQESDQRSEPALHHNCVVTSNERCVPASRSKNLTNYTSTTQITGSSNQTCSGFKTGNNTIIPVLPEAMQKAKALFDDLSERDITDVNTTVIPVKQEFVPHTESSLCTEMNLTKPLNSVKRPEYKSNEVKLIDQVQDSQATLTASQSADVTELCSLFEDAGSQFEFTQSSKWSSHCPDDGLPHQSSEKELDPDLLTGIDFDHTFSSDAEKQLAKMATPDKMTTPHRKQICKVKSTGTSFYKEDISIGRALSITSCSPENKTSLVAEEANSFNMANLENKRLPTCGLGFKTAGGNTLKVSEIYLRKARTMFADLEENQKENTGAGFESLNTEMTHEEQKEPSPLKHRGAEKQSNAGFLLASGKGVTISVKAIQEASVFFKDCDVKEGLGCLSSPKLDKPCVEATAICSGSFERNNCGFNTAGGKKVHVSDKSLLKAKALFGGCDELENENSGPILSKNSVKTSKDLQQDQPQDSDSGFKKSSSKTAPVSANFLSDRAGTSHSSNSTHESVALQSGYGFSTASGKKVSVSDGALLTAKALLSERNEDDDENMELKNKSRTSHTDPIKALPQKTSGKGVSTSAKCLFKGSGPKTYGTRTVEMKENSYSDEKNVSRMNPGKSNCGFTTAGGKRVHVSQKSLLRAKTLLSESPGNDCDEKNADVKRQPSMESDSHPTGLEGTASGKTVCVSDGSPRKARSLQNDGTGNGDVMNSDRLDPAKTKALKTPKMPLFSTAGGIGVPVSEKALQEVKSFFSLCETGNVRVAAAACNDAGGRFGFSTASGKGVSVSEKALKEAFDKFREGDNDTLIGVQEHRKKEKNPPDIPAPFSHEQLVPVNSRTPEDYEIQSSVGMAHKSLCAYPDGSVLLNFESLGLSSCTAAQQEYFAQEAMDCTKALLEDEDLTDQGSLTTGTTPMQENPFCNKHKRTGEDADMKEQPPLKRRRQLLAEFDRTSNRQSALTPAISCSDGMLKDRRDFKYNASLQPNITRPYRDKKSFVDPTLNKAEPQNTRSDSIPRDIKSPTAGIAVFIPPFRKNVRTEKSSTPQDKGRTTGVFVPPFRKQTSMTSEKSLQLPNKNTPHQLFKPPIKTNVPVPAPLIEESQRSETNTGFSRQKNTETQKLDPQKINTIDGVSGDEGEKELAAGPGRKGAPAKGSTPEQKSPDSREMYLDIQSLQLARDMQDMRIMKKKRQTVRPLPGSLYLAKTSGVTRVPLREAVKGRCPFQHTEKQLYGYGVHHHVSQISSENAESFRFHCRHFFMREAFVDGGAVQLADGGWLIPRNDGTTGKQEFYRALCDTPGVDPKLISEEWVCNHYRWIVWKQAAMERSFPEVMGSVCLTPEQILLQLKYRYDVEVDLSRRPALRKIMERDDTAAKTMVLCVCGVVSRGQNPTRQNQTTPKALQGADSNAESPVGVIWLTDGWYAIKAQMDVPLTCMMHKGRLAVGGKVVIHGAELVGSQDACSPLEAPESLMFKIWANGTRPARWDAKLGFHSDPRPFLLPLHSLYSNGGPVGCVDMIVLRSYPTQWMEKKLDGGFVFRSGRVEEKEARRHGDSKHKAMEIIFAKVQDQFERENGDNKTRRRTLSHQDIESLQDGEELHEAMENDRVCLEALSQQQMETLNGYRRSLGERRQAQLQERFRKALEKAQESEGGGGCPNREVTQVWKLSIADSRDLPGTNVCMLTIWRPSMELQCMLKEGCRYKVYNLSTSEGKKQIGNASIQLTATKKTQFQEIQTSQEWLSEHFQARVSASFLDLRKPEYQPFCGEVDLVGYVVTITDTQGSSPVIYLVDGKLDFVKVRCSGSLVQLGLEHLVKPLALLALSNLQLRYHHSSPVPSLYAGDLALFSINPKETHLQGAFAQLRTLVQGNEHFFHSAEERLSNLIPSDGPSSIPSPLLRTPSWKTEQGRTNITPQQPIRSLGFFTPLSRNSSSSVEKDPKSLKRKRGLDYLCRIPSPPPLFPLGTMTSPCVSSTFNPPRRSETPRSLKRAQTPAPRPAPPPVEGEWVNDEELAMIDTQALHDGI